VWDVAPFVLVGRFYSEYGGSRSLWKLVSICQNVASYPSRPDTGHRRENLRSHIIDCTYGIYFLLWFWINCIMRTAIEFSKWHAFSVSDNATPVWRRNRRVEFALKLMERWVKWGKEKFILNIWTTSKNCGRGRIMLKWILREKRCGGPLLIKLLQSKSPVACFCHRGCNKTGYFLISWVTVNC